MTVGRTAEIVLGITVGRMARITVERIAEIIGQMIVEKANVNPASMQDLI